MPDKTDEVKPVMTRKEWYDHCMSKGTSGDQVFSILRDWERTEVKFSASLKVSDQNRIRRKYELTEEGRKLGEKLVGAGLINASKELREKLNLRHDEFGCGSRKCPHWQLDCFNCDWVVDNGMCEEMKDQILAPVRYLIDRARKEGAEELAKKIEDAGEVGLQDHIYLSWETWQSLKRGGKR